MGLFDRLRDAMSGAVRLDLELPASGTPGEALGGSVALTAGGAALTCTSLKLWFVCGNGESVWHEVDAARGAVLGPDKRASWDLDFEVPAGFDGHVAVRATADIPGLPDPTADGSFVVLGDDVEDWGARLEAAAAAVGGLARETLVRSGISFAIVPFEAGLEDGECFDLGTLFGLLVAAEALRPAVIGDVPEVPLIERDLTIRLDHHRWLEDLALTADDPDGALGEIAAVFAAFADGDAPVYLLEGEVGDRRVVDAVIAVPVSEAAVLLLWTTEVHPSVSEVVEPAARTWAFADVADLERCVVFAGGAPTTLWFATVDAEGLPLGHGEPPALDDPAVADVAGYRTEVLFVDPADPTARVVAADVLVTRATPSFRDARVQLSESWAGDALTWGEDELPDDGETGWYAVFTAILTDGTERRGPAARVIAAVADVPDTTELPPEARFAEIVRATADLGVGPWVETSAREAALRAFVIPRDGLDLAEPQDLPALMRRLRASPHAPDDLAARHLEALTDPLDHLGQALAAAEAAATWRYVDPDERVAGLGFRLLGLLAPISDSEHVWYKLNERDDPDHPGQVHELRLFALDDDRVLVVRSESVEP